MITDAVGIKTYFLQEAFNLIDEDVEFVSGHPMAGREKKAMNTLVKKFLQMQIIS
ncbi:prephenate dehydrogenase/arogenate dehydrogenase family protein [Coprobacillaceae bacterium CR2/5/TPMF4]|nr:prephenate dehydrogenase/arogenate dehydrogenase family protein [Coprobacillaceae bacterium CR2/5/TPMF4]